MSGDNGPKYTFQYLDGRKFPSFESKENNQLFMKWFVLFVARDAQIFHLYWILKTFLRE